MRRRGFGRTLAHDLDADAARPMSSFSTRTVTLTTRGCANT